MNVTLSKVVASVIGGVSIGGTISRTRSGESAEPLDVANVPAAVAGTLTTRTDNDTGVATVTAGHGFITGDVLDVYWSGGVRYGMTATVSTNAITVDGGAGTSLPAASTVLTVAKRQIALAPFDPTLVQLLAVVADKRMSVRLMATAVVALALDLVAEEPYTYVADDGVATPLGTDPITAIHFSSGVAEVNRIRLGTLLNSVAAL